MPKRDVKIKCHNIWKIFGDSPKNFLESNGNNPSQEQLKQSGYIGAVQDVSFDVYEGEILIIMGLSGSGKSTLVRCLTRLHEPTYGSIHYDGKDLLQATPNELIDIRRHKMGMVFQNFGLLPQRNVISNVAFPLEVRGVKRETREAQALEVIKLVGLDGREDYFPRELSGGQQQRVGIARSLVVQPDIWFLDEPFSALDPLIRAEMQDEFLRLQKLLKKTIVFITHDFEEATKLADRIGIMKDGRIVQLSTPEEMVLNPADDYVKEFTKNAPTHRILSASAIMKPLSKKIACDKMVKATDKIADIARQILSSDKAVYVGDENDKPIGYINKALIIDALFAEQPEK